MSSIVGYYNATIRTKDYFTLTSVRDSNKKTEMGKIQTGLATGLMPTLEVLSIKNKSIQQTQLKAQQRTTALSKGQTVSKQCSVAPAKPTNIPK